LDRNEDSDVDEAGRRAYPAIAEKIASAGRDSPLPSPIPTQRTSAYEKKIRHPASLMDLCCDAQESGMIL